MAMPGSVEHLFYHYIISQEEHVLHNSWLCVLHLKKKVHSVFIELVRIECRNILFIS